MGRARMGTDTRRARRRSDRDPPHQDSAWRLWEETSARVRPVPVPSFGVWSGIMDKTTKFSPALGGAGFSMCSWLGRRPWSKHLESPCPFYTQDLTVLAKGPGEGPAEWQRSPVELGGDPEGSGSDAGTRDSETLPVRGASRHDSRNICVFTMGSDKIVAKSPFPDLAGCLL